MSLVFSTAFFPPVLYIKKAFRSHTIIIETNDNYQKQTYRNRTKILSANGVLPLSFPIVKKHNVKVKTKDIKIDYSINWQKNHLRSLTSAYKSSPFFEYYIDDFLKYFTKKYNYLIDYNTEILINILKIFDINKPVKFTGEFLTYNDNDDYRDKFSPKIEILETNNCKKYKQVFDNKFDFIPNLSILDMIFNLGPETEIYLRK